MYNRFTNAIRNLYPIQERTLFMHALCLVTVKPGRVDMAVNLLKKKRKVVKKIMIVTGRADICVLLEGNIDEINNMVIDFRKIDDIVATETLNEVEVNLGW